MQMHSKRKHSVSLSWALNLLIIHYRQSQTFKSRKMIYKLRILI